MMEVVLLSALSIIGLHEVVEALVWQFTGRSIDTIVLSWSSPENLGEYRDEINWGKVMKPIILCPLCMCSVWGTIFYFTFSFFYGGGVLGWIPSIFAIAGSVTVLNRMR